MSGIAPIAVFAYNRPVHVARLLASLTTNPEHAASPITIYCDGPADATAAASVERTRERVRELAPTHARIMERQRNLGLAESIISGVTEQVSEHGRVIVLEDDLELTPTALAYFNGALDRYAEEPQVTHVSAYMFPVERQLPRLFFYRECTCWGWATWKRAWEGFEPDAGKLLAEIERVGRVEEFDIGGTASFSKILEDQVRGEVDSWAIRWYATNFLRGGLSLHPGRALVRNTGCDATGRHLGATDRFDVEIHDQVFTAFPSEIEESADAVRAMQRFRRAWVPSLPVRILRRLKRMAARVLGEA